MTADRYSTSHLPEDQYEPGSNGTVLRNLLGTTSVADMEHVEEERFERLMVEAAARFDSDHRFTYKPMERMFSGIIERTLTACGR